MGLAFFMSLFLPIPSSLSLPDMSVNTIHDIFDFLEPTDRLILRKVSRDFRAFVESKDPGLKKISVIITDTVVTLVLNSEPIKYSLMNNGCMVQRGERQRFVKGEYYMDRAFKDLYLVMKNPKLQLKELRITLSHFIGPVMLKKFTTNVTSFFENLENLKVKSVILTGFGVPIVCEILSHFKEGTLEKISMSSLKDPQKTNDALISMPQWKMAKEFDMTIDCSLPMSVESLFHFAKCYVAVSTEFSFNDAIKIRDVLLECANFKELFLCVKRETLDRNGITRIFGGSNYVRDKAIKYTTGKKSYVIEISNSCIWIKKN